MSFSWRKGGDFLAKRPMGAPQKQMKKSKRERQQLQNSNLTAINFILFSPFIYPFAVIFISLFLYFNLFFFVYLQPPIPSCDPPLFLSLVISMPPKQVPEKTAQRRTGQCTDPECAGQPSVPIFGIRTKSFLCKKHWMKHCRKTQQLDNSPPQPSVPNLKRFSILLFFGIQKANERQKCVGLSCLVIQSLCACCLSLSILSTSKRSTHDTTT